MVWASDALGPDGKPAVLLLGVTRTSGALVAEAAYVADSLPEGPLGGRYYRSEGATPVRVALDWPGGWPSVRPTNKVHPRKDTPEAALESVGGVRRLRFSTT